MAGSSYQGISVARRIAASALPTGAALGFFFSQLASAGVITVDSLDDVALPNDDGNCTLREAVSLAGGGPGDACVEVGGGVADIQFAVTGTIQLIDELTISDPTNFTGPGINNLTIRAAADRRHLNLNVYNSRIQDMTLTGGSVAAAGGSIFSTFGEVRLSRTVVRGNQTVGDNNPGGAVASSDGDITVSFSQISNNSTAGIASHGGGIYSGNGDLRIESSIVSGNSVTGTDAIGGGVYNAAGAARIYSTEVSGNSASYGVGGVAASGTDLRLEDSVITGNSAEIAGGVGNIGGSYLYMLRSRVVGNEALSGSGGGIFNSGDDGGAGPVYSEAFVRDSTIANNNAGEDGGGVQNAQGAEFAAFSSTISGNTADDDGGGIYNYAGASTLLRESTISGNTASTGDGGGIKNRAAGAYTNMIHASLVDNVAGGVGDAINHPATDGENFYSCRSLVVGDGADNIATPDASSWLTCSDGGLSNDGSFVAVFPTSANIAGASYLGGLADNGGPTETHALLTGSGAIDTAAAGGCSVRPDQRGVPRPIDIAGVDDDGNECDYGAFEFGSQVLEIDNNSAATTSASVNDDNVLALDVSLSRRDGAGEDVNVTELNGSLCPGFSLDEDDLDRVAVWQDGGDGSFDAGGGDDVLVDDDLSAGGLGTLTFVPPTFSVAFTAPVTISAVNEPRYFVSFDVDDALDSAHWMPGWTQSAYAANETVSSMSLAARLAFLFAGLFLLSLPFSSLRMRGMRLCLVAGFTATALTACGGSGGGTDFDFGGGAGPSGSLFCLNITEVTATGASSTSATPVAGLPVVSTSVTVSE